MAGSSQRKTTALPKKAAALQKVSAQRKTGKAKNPAHDAQPHASLSDQAYGAIRDALRLGTIRPGDRVKERELATRLGLGRTPVREAIKRLAVQGLLAQDAGQGLVFKKLGQRDLVDIHIVWAVLQGLAAKLAAQNATEVEITAMRILHDKLTGDIKTNINQALRIARRLDQLIYQASHNDYLARHIGQLIDTVGLQSSTSTFTIAGRAAAFVREMDLIITAIEKRQPDKAEKLAREHNEKGLAARLALDLTQEG